MANISSYNQLSSWNEDDDLLFVQQPDAPKKAHPSQMKEYILRGLDVSSVGGTGKYISAISEADGKISATAETMDTAPTEGSSKAVTSGGIKTAIDDSVSLKTATGNPITLTDAANANAEELSMTIEPIQSGSGDPSPTNVRPISGLSEAVVTRTGKNLIEDILVGYNITSSGYVEVNSSYSLGIAKVVSGQSYIATTNDGSGFVGGFYYNKPTAGSVAFDNTRYVIANKQFTAPITGYVVFRFTPDYATPQIEVGTTSTNYEAPVTPATATITFSQTVYGGGVNFKTGEVTVTHGIVDLGTLEWAKQNTTASKWRFYAELGSFIPVGTGELCGFVCSTYKEVTAAQTWQGAKGISGNGLTSTNICVCDMTYTDAATFKTAMSGVQLCYELATPTTLTLTPAELELLKGNNTISGNGAEISIEYYPDNAIGALAKRVDDKADITYVDNAVDGVVKHVAGELSITIPLSDSWTASIFGTISVTPISAILTVVSGGSVSVTDLTSNSLASRADISVSVSDKTITLTSKNTDKFYVNIVY